MEHKKRQPSLLGRIASGLRGDTLSRKPSTCRERKDSDSISIRSVASTVNLEAGEVDRWFPEAIRTIDERLVNSPFSYDQKAQIVKEYLRRATGGPAQSLLVLKRLKAVGRECDKSLLMEVFHELRTLFRAEGVDWLKDFCKGLGFAAWCTAILANKEWLVSDAAFQGVVSSSLKSFTNNKFGLTVAKDDPNTFTVLCCLLNASPDPDTVKHSLQLLTVLCLIDPPKTHSLLLAGASSAQTITKQTLLFQGCLRFNDSGTKSEDHWIDFCIFLNAVVGTRDLDEDVDLRVHLRSLLFRSATRTALEDIYEQTQNQTLLQQLDFFFALLAQDRDILAARNQAGGTVDLNDIVDALKTSDDTLLSSVLRMIYSAPKDCQSSYLSFIHSCLEEMILSNAGISPEFTLLTPSPRVDINPLVHAFKEKRESESQRLLQELKSKYDQVQHQKDLSEVSFADKMNKLRDEYEGRLRSSAAEIAEWQEKHQRQQSEIDALKLQQLQQLQRLQQLQLHDHQPERHAPPQPDPLLADIQLNKSPTVKTADEPVSAKAAPPPPPPPPPMLAKGPPPPPPPPSTNRAACRPRKTPSCRMRPLQWKKIPDVKIPGTIWESLDELKWEAKVDLCALEPKFGLKTDDRPTTPLSAAHTSLTSLLSTKQSTNLEIALRKCRVPLKDATDCFLRMDETLFSAELVHELLKLDGITEQTRAAAIAQASTQSWSLAESFLVSLFQVPGFDLRLKCFQFKASFDEWAGQCKRCLETVRIAANKALKEDDLRRALEHVLLFGNYLNHGTFRGSAKGFELDALNILSTTRSVDHKATLIHSLAEAIEANCPGLLHHGTDNMALFREASNTNFNQVREEVREKILELQAIDDGLSSHCPHPAAASADRLLQVMAPYVSKAKADIGDVQAALDSTADSCARLCRMFAVDATDCSPFQSLAQFLADLGKAAGENKACRAEEEARSVRHSRAMAHTARLQAHKLRALLDTATDSDCNMVDGLLGALKK